MTRAELIEQVAKIIAGPTFTFSDGTEDEDWRGELAKAEQIVSLILDTHTEPEDAT